MIGLSVCPGPPFAWRQPDFGLRPSGFGRSSGDFAWSTNERKLGLVGPIGKRAEHQPVSEKTPQIGKIAFLGDYPPRKCGIATFTSDLLSAIAAGYPDTHCFAVPVNDLPGGYPYPREVRFEIEEQDLPSYARAADFLNISNPDLVCVQHEFGIFGGPSGSHLLALLRDLRMPVVTTL